MRLSLWFLLVFILLLLMPLTVSADVSGIFPLSGLQSETTLPFVITGSGFNETATGIQFSGNGIDWFAQNFVVISGTEIDGTLDIANAYEVGIPAPIGEYTVLIQGIEEYSSINFTVLEVESTPTPTPTETPAVIGMTLDQIMFSCYGGSCSGCQNGTSATIDVNYTFTGEQGTEASVINIGTIQDALLDFVIPRGDKGEQGDQGIPGPAGSMNQTPNMTAGPAGYTPVFGIDYFNGTQGEQGIQGIQGIANMTAGPKGDKGEQGDPASNYNASYITSTYNATYDAKPNTNYNISYDTLIGKDGYTIFFQKSAVNPNKNTYNDVGNQFQSTAGTQVYVLKSGTITAATGTAYVAGTAGTGEAWNLSIRRNLEALNGINFVGNNATTAREHGWSNTSMNLPVVAGDNLQLWWGSANWVTAPTTVTFTGYVYVAT